jgi:hypothetical protein
MENDHDILLVAIFTFITVFVWIFFDLLKTSKTSTISATTQQIVEPLNPKLNTNILNDLSQRITYK